MKKVLLFHFLVLITASIVYGQALIDHEQKRIELQGKIIGQSLGKVLERFHYRKISLNDRLSIEASKQFLKKVDFSKNYLFQKDVDRLRKYNREMDDQFKSGDYKMLNLAMEIINNRIAQAEQLRQKFLKGKFNFDRVEGLELDPEKRSYFASQKAFEEHWRKMFKYNTLERYLLMLEDSKEEGKGKNKNKKKVSKKKKKLSEEEIMQKAQEKVSKNYKRNFKRLLDEGPLEKMARFFNAITGVYDPHTVYFPPRVKEDFDIDISGSLEGIGAVLKEEGPYIKVVEIVPGGPAWRQKKLQVGDFIIMVSEKGGEPFDLLDVQLEDAVKKIRGKKGTEVTLKIKRALGIVKDVTIVRDEVKISSVFTSSSVLQHQKLKNKIGYIHLPKFYRNFDKGGKNSTDDVKAEIELLKKQKVNGIIVDLRNNTGGALDDASSISGLFINKGPIVQIKDNFGRINSLKDRDGKIYYQGPVIIMINQHSASASEIMAAALQDYRRGIIVGGQYTHGKGTVQSVIDIRQPSLNELFSRGMGALKITTQKFYRINGGSTQVKGVTADIILPDPFGHSESREKDHTNPIPWDRVPPLKYAPWKISSSGLANLRKKSAERVKKSKGFKNIMALVNYLSRERNDTLVSLNIKTTQKQRKVKKKMMEKFKFDQTNKEIAVTGLMASANLHKHSASDTKDNRWLDNFREKEKKWIESIRQDIILQEALFIMEDMITMKVVSSS